MMYIAGFLFFLSATHLLRGYRKKQKDAQLLGYTFFLAGIGSALASYFALHTIGLL